MTSSVPPTIPIQDLKWRLAKCLELAHEAIRLTGDISALEMTMELVHSLHEEIKLLANTGKMDSGYVAAVGRAIDKIDGFIERRRSAVTNGE